MLNFATKDSFLLPEKRRKKENARILYNIIDKINVFFFTWFKFTFYLFFSNYFDFLFVAFCSNPIFGSPKFSHILFYFYFYSKERKSKKLRRVQNFKKIFFSGQLLFSHQNQELC
jgi:hypothetical protein